MEKILANKKNIAILVLPGLFVFAFAVFVPIIMSMYYGTMDWDGISPMKFIGIKNFQDILVNDPTFWVALVNALILGICLIFIQHPICMAVAIMLDKVGGKAEKIFRVLIFIPCMISTVVTSKMWVSIYDYNYGVLNKLLSTFHLGFLKQDWLGQPSTVIGALVVVIMWQGFGWGMLIYYAGVKGLPEDVFEAARIDGASGMKLFKSITFPLLQPVIKVNVTLAAISALKQMETVYLTTNGGPGNSSQFMANYLYTQAFSSSRYGYGNAISVLFVAACLIATFLLNKLLRSDSVEY